MTDLTLPGTIPGLLRRGSPILVGSRQESTVVTRVDGREVGVFVGWLNAVDHRINLDLSDVTGRAHAAWWLVGSSDPDDVGDFLVRGGLDVLRFCAIAEKAATGDDLSDEDILLLRCVILYVAGVVDNG